MSIRTVIFDLDGTITKPFLDFDTIREEMGLARDAGSILEIMEKMPPRQRKETEEILHRHEMQAIEQSCLNEGVEKTLNSLRAASINIGILTRNRRINALAVACKHNIEFDAVVGRDDGPVKPDGFGVLKLCEHFGTGPQETLVVGDYLYDLLSAKAAGAIAVLLKTHKQNEDFSKYSDFTIHSLDETLSIIEDINRQS
jgi:HAD superfamily hydrolase (TIGR01509 family)